MPCFLEGVGTKEWLNAPVAVLDSGAGGIDVLGRIQKKLPYEDLLYFADSAHAPYGERSHAEILSLVTAHAARLLGESKALVLACNTATAVAVEAIRAAHPHRVIVGMEPALLPALAAAGGRGVLVLCTEATLREPRFCALCERAPATAVRAVAATGLVRLVERGLFDSPQCEEYFRELLAPFMGQFDAIVLGCTHFPFAKGALSRVVGDVPIFDGAEGTAAELGRRLAVGGLLRQTAVRGRVRLTASDGAALPLYRRLFALAGEAAYLCE